MERMKFLRIEKRDQNFSVSSDLPLGKDNVTFITFD